MIEKKRAIIQIIFILILVIILIYITPELKESQVIVDLVKNYGYLAVFTLSIISGFNILIPFPPALLGTLFIELELNTFIIVPLIIIGITIADMVAFYIGRIAKNIVFSRKTVERILKYSAKYKYFHIILIIIWASFIPLPNEVILIPLALIGYQAKKIIIPLIIGNIIGTIYFLTIGTTIFNFFT